MYKGGLVFGLIFQVFMVLGLIVAGIGVGLALASSPPVSEGVRVPLVPEGATVPPSGVVPDTTLSPESIFGIAFGVSSIIPIAQILVTSLALSNLVKSERGEAYFNKTLAVIAGIVNLMPNIIAGILILVGMSDAE